MVPHLEVITQAWKNGHRNVSIDGKHVKKQIYTQQGKHSLQEEFYNAGVCLTRTRQTAGRYVERHGGIQETGCVFGEGMASR